MTATAPNRDNVALSAYFIWDNEGRPHGRHEDHWFAAEAALAGAAEPKAALAAPVKKAAPAKAAGAKKAVAAKKAAPAKAAPKAPAEAVVAAAALAAPRAARSTAKGSRRAH